MQKLLKSCSFVLSVALLACSSNGPKSPDGASGGGSGSQPIPPRFAPGDCNLEMPAFCETFEKESPGGRGGPLDEKEWSVARWGLPVTGYQIFARRAATSEEEATNTPSFCGSPFDGVLPPDDIRFCEGTDAEGFASKQLHEVFHDDESFAFTSMRIRQPFDFTGRTGTIVFDVDAKRSLNYDGHGWWVELWLSADPVPMPYHGAPTVASFVRKAVGFQLAPQSGDCFKKEDPLCNEFGRVVILNDYKVTRDTNIDSSRGFIAADGKLNRFKILLSQDRAELWASNVDAKGEMVRVAKVENLGLDWSRGYVHIQHAQYNAMKIRSSASQTYRWDNIAFDGPTFPTPRGYDAVDNAEMVGKEGVVVMKYGYDMRKRDGSNVPVEVPIPEVDLTDAVKATLNFNYYTTGNREFEYRLNDNEWRKHKTPAELGREYQLRALSIEVPLEELVPGDNTVGFRVAKVSEAEGVGNVDLTIETSP